ncbi:putative transcriptional regulator cudA [Eriocheir sinensis]|uniref:putative transcriptional regulator cudA n=1 Tax=Eriocheir sinensis TaxID=95602 RepID=UPI0021C61005|nr:putative transcriptional regulator cudA [Eriocheir sinensis]
MNQNNLNNNNNNNNNDNEDDDKNSINNNNNNQGAHAIDCFKCVSVNGDNPSCEDPFHNNFSTAMLESPCMAGRKGREGLFPATACIKLAGVYDQGRGRIVVRACALDSGTLTTDTEIIRMSHCGGIVYNDKCAGRYLAAVTC